MTVRQIIDEVLQLQGFHLLTKNIDCCKHKQTKGVFVNDIGDLTAAVDEILRIAK